MLDILREIDILVGKDTIIILSGVSVSLDGPKVVFPKDAAVVNAHIFYHKVHRKLSILADITNECDIEIDTILFS